ITGILRYRKVVSWTCLVAVLVVIVLVALAALARPRWFRGYYRFATRLGFYTIQFLGKVVLAGFFFFFFYSYPGPLEPAACGEGISSSKTPPKKTQHPAKAKAG